MIRHFLVMFIVPGSSQKLTVICRRHSALREMDIHSSWQLTHTIVHVYIM